mgnify:CR=1 FL=1
MSLNRKIMISTKLCRNDLKCSSCDRDNLTVGDFGNRSDSDRRKQCKKCIDKIRIIKQDEKKAYKEKFGFI